MGKVTLATLVQECLEESETALSAKEVLQVLREKKGYTSKGKTPEKSISRELTTNKKFQRVSSGKYKVMKQVCKAVEKERVVFENPVLQEIDERIEYLFNLYKSSSYDDMVDQLINQEIDKVTKKQQLVFIHSLIQ